MFTSVVSRLPFIKKNCLGFNHVIWRFFSFGLLLNQISKFKILSPTSIQNQTNPIEKSQPNQPKLKPLKTAFGLDVFGPFVYSTA